MSIVCVTGAAGRLGTRCVRRLLTGSTSRIRAFDQRACATTDSRVEPAIGDLLDADDLARALAGCEVVLHLAALTAAPRSFADPDSYFRVNTQGTLALLAACRRQGVRRVVFASTCLVYGAPQSNPITEEHPTRPQSPYAASKLAAEVALASYADACGLSVDMLRLSNVYGAADQGETAIGSALEQATAGRNVTLRDLSPVRDFIHVDDVVEGVLRVADVDHEPGCRVLNLSTGRGTSVGEMAEALIRVVREAGGPALSVAGTQSATSGNPVVLDNARLRQRTGWVPGITAPDGLMRAYREAVGK